MTEVSIRSTFKEDLYAVLSAWDDQGKVTFHFFVNPLVQLIWIGIGIMVCGGIFLLFPDRKPSAAVVRKKPRLEVRDEAA